MKKRILFSLMGLILCATTWAQLPQEGKYYRIKNTNYGTIMSENWMEGTVSCVTENRSEWNQVWRYATGGKLQNVYTGKYLMDQPAQSHQYKTSTGATNGVKAIFQAKSDGHLTIATNNHYLHCDAGRSVVNWWDANTEGSHWTIEEVSLTTAEVLEIRKEYQRLSDLQNNASAYNEDLQTFFTNALCTELKAEYASMDDNALKTAMADAGLPEMLQDIAVKVKNDWWTNTASSAYADANKYAKDFRVATYKPYSDANNWRDKMNTYAPSFMGNPTGIYATKSKEIIHVFVGNDIPEGATLYLTPIRNHGRIGGRYEGIELKKGYNAVVGSRDSLVYFINYVVNTIPTSNVNAHTKTIAKISDFPNMDIHIEGGQCVGYYQKPAENNTDEDAKYQYLINNAKNDMYFMVKGATSLFYFKKYTYTQHFPKTIWNSINWFDRLHFWEFAIIGVMDDVANGLCENGTEYSKAAYPLNIKGGDAFYPTYCNNPTMAMEGPNGQNPHATTFYTSYPGDGGVESSFNAERANFDNWCAGHEHGHQIQGAYNLESCSESSVNLPSNIITYLTGFRLGRGWNFEQNYAYVADNVVFGARDISITMRMYYNLFLYYHIGGKKKDFYPTFVKSLREDPMDFSRDGVQYSHPEWGAPSGGHHRATKTWIKFYKKACEAAQEDLTEYFRLWGFFVPCDKVYLGDYTSYAVSLTQEEIDAAIAEVKAKKYPENLQIMFVEDRQIPRERTDIWAHTATGTQKYKPTNWEAWWNEEQLKAEYGDVGDILTYIDGSANTSEYTYILSGTKLTLKGQGGVGFIVYDKAGNNVYMSNRYSFEIPAKVAADDFTIKCINADGTSSVVKNASETATDEEKLVILQKAIETTKAYTSLEDPKDTKIGYYSTEDLAVLKALVADANTAIKAGNVDVYMTLADKINNEILKIQIEKRDNRIVSNGLYLIGGVRAINSQTRYLAIDSKNILTTQTSANNRSRWAFVATGNEDEYYLQNRQDISMVGAELNEKGGVTAIKRAEAYPDSGIVVCKIQSLGGGKFGIRPKDNTYINLDGDNSGNVTIWHGADEGSQWIIDFSQEFDETITDETVENAITLAEDLIADITEDATPGSVVMKAGFEGQLSRTNNVITYKNIAAKELEKDLRTTLGTFVVWTNLNTFYKNLYDKAIEIDPTVDINDIQGTEENTDKVIYDLSGRKVNNANAKGVFIVGGKVVVK